MGMTDPENANRSTRSTSSSTTQRSSTASRQAPRSTTPSSGRQGSPGSGAAGSSRTAAGRSSQSDSGGSNRQTVDRNTSSGRSSGNERSSASDRDRINRVGGSASDRVRAAGAAANKTGGVNRGFDFGGVADEAADRIGLGAVGGFSQIGQGTTAVGDLAAMQQQAKVAVQNFLGNLNAKSVPVKSLTNANVTTNAAIREMYKREFIDEITKGPLGKFPTELAGILSRVEAESGFDVMAHNPEDPGAKGSIGAMQWNKSRIADLENFAEENEWDPTDARVQARFVAHELLSGKEKAAWAKIKGAETPEEAAIRVGKYYARPANSPKYPGEKLGQRTAVAAAPGYFDAVTQKLNEGKPLLEDAAYERMFEVAAAAIAPGQNYTPIRRSNEMSDFGIEGLTNSIAQLVGLKPGSSTKPGVPAVTTAESTGSKTVKTETFDVAADELRRNNGVDALNIAVGEFFGQAAPTPGTSKGDELFAKPSGTPMAPSGRTRQELMPDFFEAISRSIPISDATMDEKEAQFAKLIADKAASPDPVDKIMAAAFAGIAKQLGGGVPGDAAANAEAARKRSGDNDTKKKTKQAAASTPEEPLEEPPPSIDGFFEAIKAMGLAAVAGAGRVPKIA